jgi:cytochrome c oxidase cbb3-type subunit 3
MSENNVKHVFDGIEELDNPPPTWFNLLFMGTIVWGIGYLILMPGIGPGMLGWTQDKRYEAEVAAAKEKFAQAAPATIDLAAAMNDPAIIADGKKIYATTCAACHGPEGQGAIGPNLTDAEWLYGGTAEEIVKTVTNGAPKGMPAWESQLGAANITKVSAFVHSLGGGL